MPRSEQDPPRESPEDWRSDEKRELPPGHIDALRSRESVGRISDKHWTRSRSGKNREAIEYLRERSRAPGVAEGGAERNSYCLECDGVIPLQHDSREPAARETRRCPHCDAELPRHIQRMFNWVEIDQIQDSDLRALLPWLLTAVVVLAGLAFWLLR